MSMTERQGSRRTTEFYPENPLGPQTPGARRSLEHRITETPISAVLITFGVGFGLGAIAGSMLARSGRLHWREPEDIASTLGQRVLDSLTEILPETWRARGLWS